jgi:hypothetical protein
MINVIEAAALAAVERLLPAGHQSLGIHLDVPLRRYADRHAGPRHLGTGRRVARLRFAPSGLPTQLFVLQESKLTRRVLGHPENGIGRPAHKCPSAPRPQNR